jgi:hypothetical protein
MIPGLVSPFDQRNLITTEFTEHTENRSDLPALSVISVCSVVSFHLRSRNVAGPFRIPVPFGLNRSACSSTEPGMTPFLRRWCGALLLLVPISAVRCGTTTRHGDATLHTERPIMGPVGYQVWRLEFPEVRLSEQGRHVFRARGVPRLVLGFDVLMDVAEARRHEQDITSAPWRDTVVTVTVLTPAGVELGRERHRLSELFGRNGFGASEYEDLPLVTRAVPPGGDYDVDVRVDHPSTRGSDRVRIRGEATTGPKAGVIGG